MSLRRKIALWLCPALGEQPMAQVDYYPSAQGWARETLADAKAATDATWKAEVLEQLKAVNAMLSKLKESGGPIVVAEATAEEFLRNPPSAKNC